MPWSQITFCKVNKRPIFTRIIASREKANFDYRLIAQEQSITRRKGTSPIRVLIEATLPEADLRQKSRWVRALEYISSEGIPPREFRKFVHANGGLAGCARHNWLTLVAGAGIAAWMVAPN
jgi:hypothetical protein